jgi:hypothetical protein
MPVMADFAACRLVTDPIDRHLREPDEHAGPAG